jgi:hypothetical protein
MMQEVMEDVVPKLGWLELANVVTAIVAAVESMIVVEAEVEVEDVIMEEAEAMIVGFRIVCSDSNVRLIVLISLFTSRRRIKSLHLDLKII